MNYFVLLCLISCSMRVVRAWCPFCYIFSVLFLFPLFCSLLCSLNFLFIFKFLLFRHSLIFFCFFLFLLVFFSVFLLLCFFFGLIYIPVHGVFFHIRNSLGFLSLLCCFSLPWYVLWCPCFRYVFFFHFLFWFFFSIL